MLSEAVQRFLEQGQRSGLFASAEAQQAIAQLTAEQPLTAEELSARLVEKKVLTAYQAEQLLAGKGEECLIAQRYRLLEKLGAGGMGTVYKAQDIKLDRLVALKVLSSHLVQDPGAVARFQREARALAKVSHPAIVQAHDVGEDRGRHFLVMEYVTGTSLDRLVKEQGRLAPTLAADYIHQAAMGLQHAHNRGLIHRDLKPSNLLVTPARRIKILDLGLARFIHDQLGDPQLTREGTGLGTPDYMAPEQFGDARLVDHRADIYALGCTLYHLLTGRVPFPGSSLSEKAQAHETQEPEPLETLCPDIPVGLILVVQRMMAKRPADRFRSAGELAEALAPYVSGSSTSLPEIKKTTSWHGSQLSFTVPRHRRRRTLAAAVAGSAALALIVVLSLFVPGLLRKQETPSPDNQASRDLTPKEPGEKAPPQVPADPNVLTVSKDPKDGGQFRSIGEALDKVQPGQIVRVLDRAEYRESLVLNSPDRYRGVTLEAVQGATLVCARERGSALTISQVRDVTVRGFRFVGGAAKTTMIHVRDFAPGVRLEDLHLEPGVDPDYDGILLQGLRHQEADAPLIVQDCTFRGGKLAVVVAGVLTDHRIPQPCSRLVLRNNRFRQCGINGIKVIGHVEALQIVGNRFQGGVEMGAIQLEHLADKARNILIANNTFLDCLHAFRLWDSAVKGQDIEFRNNLLLGGNKLDMLFLDSGGMLTEVRGPGDGSLIVKHWQMDHNWRETQPPSGDDLISRSWVPPAAKDVSMQTIPVLSRQGDHPDFLRPAKDSPLATGGAGKEDPSLPVYVGAVPPQGVPAWAWDKTWRWRVSRGAPAAGTTGGDAAVPRTKRDSKN